VWEVLDHPLLLPPSLNFNCANTITHLRKSKNELGLLFSVRIIVAAYSILRDSVNKCFCSILAEGVQGLPSVGFVNRIGDAFLFHGCPGVAPWCSQERPTDWERWLGHELMPYAMLHDLVLAQSANVVGMSKYLRWRCRETHLLSACSNTNTRLIQPRQSQSFRQTTFAVRAT
jgi:hypothetical protein